MESTELKSNFESNLQTSSVPLKELLKSKQDVELARIIFDIPFLPADFIKTYLDLWIHAKLPYKISEIKDPVVGFIVRRHQLPGCEEQIIFQYLTDKDYHPTPGIDQIPSILDMIFEPVRCYPIILTTPKQKFEFQEEMWSRVNQIFKNIRSISKIFK